LRDAVLGSGKRNCIIRSSVKTRLILGVGLGSVVKQDFKRFGEVDNKIRAEKLDESIEILQGLWKGEPFSFSGSIIQ
jgi:alkanesulfonate monooxygenase SsuD/methylene tetrahydromethanopterin reductase-like flavin-dependent oxidoreductase (luciferase family)